MFYGTAVPQTYFIAYYVIFNRELDRYSLREKYLKMVEQRTLLLKDSILYKHFPPKKPSCESIYMKIRYVHWKTKFN